MTASDKAIREAVRQHYAQHARAASSCCGPQASSCCGPATAEAVAQSIGYSPEELSDLPDEAISTLGCGNPLAFAGVQPGDVVLDLGSGPGMDCILAARKVGEGGRVIGLDMTPEMIERARENTRRAGVDHLVEFRLGEIEDMPVDDASVDWIISNCVINLSPDKAQVFREAYRVLRPGGRLLVSDIVASNLPEAVRRDLSAWAECVAGAMEESEYLDTIRAAGFTEIAIVERVDAGTLEVGSPQAVAEAYQGADSAKRLPVIGNPPKVYSVRVSAVKPVDA